MKKPYPLWAPPELEEIIYSDDPSPMIGEWIYPGEGMNAIDITRKLTIDVKPGLITHAKALWREIKKRESGDDSSHIIGKLIFACIKGDVDTIKNTHAKYNTIAKKADELTELAKGHYMLEKMHFDQAIGPGLDISIPDVMNQLAQKAKDWSIYIDNRYPKYGKNLSRDTFCRDLGNHFRLIYGHHLYTTIANAYLLL